MDGVWPWIIGFFVLWLVFGGRGKAGRSCSRRSRPGKVTTHQETEELHRLREALADSHAQIATLTSRLEAIETIVTDEERALRREFRDLERAGA